MRHRAWFAEPVMVFVGLLATALFIVLTAKAVNSRRWGKYIAAAFLAAIAGFIAGFIWFETVECTAYSSECDLGPIYGIIWALAGAVGCLVIGGVIEIAIERRRLRD